MTVLVVSKPTNFELHGQRVEDHVARGYMVAADLDDLKSAHDQHYRTLDLLKSEFQKRGVGIVHINRDEAWPGGEYEAVFTVGGDGTLLSSSHNVHKTTPVIGIRSSTASVGYTCAASEGNLVAMLDQWQGGDLEFIPVRRMKVTLFRGSENGRAEVLQPVLNDVLFANVSPAATTRYRISLGDDSELHKSSGVWIATPVGSTAAILAAGGHRVPITSHQLQFRVRELYEQPDMPTKLAGGLFDPDEIKLRLENHNEHALIALDGARHDYLLEFGDWIEIDRASDLRLCKPELAEL